MDHERIGAQSPFDPAVRVPPAQEHHGQRSHHGQHVCQIYTSPEERMDAVFDFLRTALKSGEQTYCISERPSAEVLDEYLSGYGVSLKHAEQNGQFHPGLNRDFYLRDGVFNPFRMMTQWGQMLREATARGSARLWAIGDVLPELRYLYQGTQLTIYETRLEEWLQSNRATIVCQYDARAFDACTAIGMLRIHPLVLANGRVAESPFYLPPDPKRSH
jgi:hypothetical protein